MGEKKQSSAKKKMMIGLIVLGVIGGLTLSIKLSVDMMHKSAPVSDTSQTQQTPKEEVQPQFDQSQLSTEKPQAVQYGVPDNSTAKSLTEDEIKNYETQARQSFEAFNFVDGTDKLKNVVLGSNLSENGQILKQLYYEGSLMSNLKDNDGQGVKNIISGIKDPENLLLAVLSVDDIQRQALITNEESLNPIFRGTVTVLDRSIEQGELLKTVQIQYQVKQLHRFTFSIEGNNLYGYVIESPNGTAKVYSIKEVTPGSTKYMTVQKWRELLKSTKK